MAWQNGNGIFFIKNGAIGTKIAGFGLEDTIVDNGWKVKKDVVSIFPILHERGFSIVIFSNQGPYASNKVTPINLHRPRDFDEARIKSLIESVIIQLPGPVSIYMTNDTKKHKPSDAMWNAAVSKFDGDSFYCGGHAGRPRELTDDDIRFAKTIGIPFKYVEYMSHWQFIKEIMRLQKITPDAIIPEVKLVPEVKPIVPEVKPAVIIVPEVKPAIIVPEVKAAVIVPEVKTEDLDISKFQQQPELEINEDFDALMRANAKFVPDDDAEELIPSRPTVVVAPSERADNIGPPTEEITIMDNCSFAATSRELAILLAPPGVFRNLLLDILEKHYKVIKSVSEIGDNGRYLVCQDTFTENILIRYLVFEIDKAKAIEHAQHGEKIVIGQYYKNFVMPVEKQGIIVNKFAL